MIDTFCGYETLIIFKFGKYMLFGIKNFFFVILISILLGTGF